MTSIIEESKQARKKFKFKFGKKTILILIIILLVSSLVYYFFNKNNKQEVITEQKIWSVKKDDLSIAIESDGKVVAEDGVELSFSVSGDNLEIEQVFVKEGDKILKGDKIATVKTSTLEMNVRNAYASYLAVLADYNEIMAGASDSEIASAKDKITTAEISLTQFQISLANTKQSAEDSIRNAKNNLDENKDELSSQDVNDAYDALVDTLKSINISFNSILRNSDEIIGVDDEHLNDAYENLLGAKDSTTLSQAKTTYTKARDSLKTLNALVIYLNNNSNYLDIDIAAEQTLKTLEIFEDHLYRMKLVLDATITSEDLSQNSLNSFIATIDSNRSAINTKITTLNSKTTAVDEAKDGLADYIIDYDNALAEADRNIKNAEASLQSKELSLEQAKRDYQELLDPLTTSEKNSANSKLTSASISLEKAQLDLKQATIISPIDGEVAMLNYKTGDIIVDNSASDPVAVIINNDTLFIEAQIEEAEINNIKNGQIAYATFDSLEGLKLEGEVTFISLTSETDNSGIVTYLVRIVINNKGDVQIREGMTAFVDFVTAEAKDVLIIPVAAVKNVNNNPSVLSQSGDWIPVVTGFTDGQYVEVISGLNNGDKIFY